MQQRQLRLGDILDDYCPRERRVTNHAVVAMVGDDVKQTRCTTCDAEHEYKHGKVPRQRRKAETPAALYAQVLANGPKRVVHENHENGVNGADATAAAAPADEATNEQAAPSEPPEPAAAVAEPAPSEPAVDAAQEDVDENDPDRERDTEEGPIHRRLIRASLPRPEPQHDRHGAGKKVRDEPEMTAHEKISDVSNETLGRFRLPHHALDSGAVGADAAAIRRVIPCGAGGVESGGGDESAAVLS